MHNISTEEHKLIGDIYDAAMNARLWPEVLSKIATHTQAKTANIIAMDQLNPTYNLFFPHNIPEQCLIEYQESGWNVVDMKVVGAGLAKFGVGVPHTSIDVFGSIENVQKEYGDYYGFLQKWGMTSQLGALLDYGDFRWSVLGIHRPAEMGFFDKNTSTFLQHITIHIRRALQIHRQLTAVQHHNNQLYRMLDGLVAGIILVNTTGKVRYANARAEYLLKRHGALQLCPKNGLHAVHLGQNQTLQSLLQGAIRTGQRENSVLTGGVIGLQRTLGETPLMLTVTPLSQLSGYKELASDGVAAAIFLTNPDGSHTLSRKLLQQSYGLTERESELCNAFVNQATLEGAAESCGLSLASVRTYLKAIYEKTGQHSQAELMRLLMGLRVDFEHIR